MIYDQYYLMSQGLAVTWDNPDIHLERLDGTPVPSHELLPGTTYRVVSHIWNLSEQAPAANLPVRLSFLSFGIATTRTFIDETFVNLPVKGSPAWPVVAQVDWTTPSGPGHYCLQAEMIWPEDANPNNNLGQLNTDVKALASTSCAIGRVIDFEPPSGKSFPDSIDNDFSFNILLRPVDAPAGLTDNPFVDSGWFHNTDAERLDAVRQGYQGESLTEQDTPRPHEASDGDPRYGGYTRPMFYDAASNSSGAATTFIETRIVWFLDGSVRYYSTSTPGAYSVPVLHCECEGTRIQDVFSVADELPGGGGAGCRKHWYTRAWCFILNLLFAPMAAAFIAEAWSKARDGNYHDAMDGNGDLNTGVPVAATARFGPTIARASPRRP